jgi:tripeptide aminopeptidase
LSRPQLEKERLIQTLIELCRIPSPSGSEGAVRSFISEHLHRLGYETSQDDFGNLYVSTETTESENMFLSSHMDTVPLPENAEITVLRQNGRISSDGTTILGGDDKQGVAAAIEILTLCQENPGLHRGLDVIFTVREELGSQGGGAVDPGRIRSRNGFNLDGETAPGTVIHHAPRKERFRCRVHGKSSHAALDPESGINAIVIAGKILSRLPLGLPGTQSTSNVGQISGGSQTNIVPDYAEFVGELRSFSEAEFESIRSDINNICRETAEESGGSAEIEWEFLYDGYLVDRDALCSQWFISACLEKNLEPTFLTSRGGGDSNQLNAKGLQNLVFGLGMNSIHSSSEYLVEEEYIDAVELLNSIVFPDP